MQLRVLAPLVLARDEKGRTHHLYEGAVVDFIDASHAAYLLKNGMVAASGSGQPSPVVAGDEVVAAVSDGDPDADLPRPPHIAAKARWVDYAVSQGFSRDEAESMTKEKLIATVGGNRGQ